MRPLLSFNEIQYTTSTITSTITLSQTNMKKFQLTSPYKPAGDQPQAIAKLVAGLNNGLAYQTLLGVTGSGKTYTMANVIAEVQRPTIVLAHNKTLAAQLYGEFKSFFAKNAVEYFVSYYDYYQPEAYVAASDTFIEKTASINEYIEQMRLSATKSLLERTDVIIVATVSSIYGLGAPEHYLSLALHLKQGDTIDQRELLRHMAELQYTRNDLGTGRATYRVRGEIIDIFPAESDDEAIRIELFDDTIERLYYFDPLTGKAIRHSTTLTIYPKTHFVTPRSTVLSTIASIEAELKDRLQVLRTADRLVEAQRLEQRVRFDIEMLNELGYCTGIENYSRYLSQRQAGEPPPTLFDYIPKNALLVIDESHVTVPQIGGMFKGDRARKENLVNYGFRLPSALDNRPLMFPEFEQIGLQTVFVSATPSVYEAEHTGQTVEQLIRPTGIVDPEITVKPATHQIDDLLHEIGIRVKREERVLVTTLTKRMAENLTEFLDEHGIRVCYLHSDIDTVERVEIIRDLRLGKFDVLVGINLLREGLDIPEVSLVAILDADKEGFLRSERSLIQTMGRAARHPQGQAILYGDKITGSMERAMQESDRRRTVQKAFNKEHQITPKGMTKSVTDILEIDSVYGSNKKQEQPKTSRKIAETSATYNQLQTPEQIAQQIKKLEKAMLQAAKNLEFEQAGDLRDQIHGLKDKMLKQG